MKFVAITLLALIAAVAANPINVSDNNIGDIVTVGVNANLEISNKVNQNILSIIVALLNREDGENIQVPDFPEWPEWPEFRNLSPEMIERIRAMIPRK